MADPFDYNPYVGSYLNKAYNEVAARPFDQYQGPRVAGFDQAQQQGMGMAQQRATQGNPLVPQAQGYMSQALQGQFNVQPGQSQVESNPYYGQNNPYLTQAIDSAQGDLARNYNMTAAPRQIAAARRSGSFGNSGLQQAEAYEREGMARAMGDIGQNMRMQDYQMQTQLGEADVGRRFAANQADLSRGMEAGKFNATYGMAAAGQAPGLAQADYFDADRLMQVGGMRQNQQQAQYQSDWDKWNEQRNYPLDQLNIMGNAIGRTGTGAGYVGRPEDSGGNRAGSALGGGLLGYQVGNAIGGTFDKGTFGNTWGGAIGGLLGAAGGYFGG